jgi:hypothetical protein
LEKPSFSLLLGHQAPDDREKLLIGIPLKTTLRSGALLVGTLPSKPDASTWWAQPGAVLIIDPTSTQPLMDLKHPMHGPPATILLEI